MTKPDLTRAEQFVLEALQEDEDNLMDLQSLKSYFRNKVDDRFSEMDFREALLHLVADDRVALTSERKLQLTS